MSDLGRQFGDCRGIYERLVEEVQFGLSEEFKKSAFKPAALLGRVKELASLEDKLERKPKYKKITDIPDLAGVRVLCLFEPELDVVAEIVRREFDIVEESNKIEELGADRMGYTGIHLVVSLGANYTGPRYDSLEGLKCEIQIRTVFQDAWALISHSLVYKSEDAVPVRLRRDLNNVSSLMEIAQSIFDVVQQKRSSYLAEIESHQASSTEFLAQAIDHDTLVAYTEWKYPGKGFSDYWQGRLLNDLDDERYKTLRDIDKIVDRAKPAVDKFATEMPNLFRFGTDYLTKSLGFIDQEFRQSHGFAPATQEAFKRLNELIGKSDST